MTSTQATKRCYLFGLPQELQDIIFAFAYPMVPGLRLRFKNDWKTEQEKRSKLRGGSSVSGTFKSLKVEEWLVSKRYFLSAANAWIGNQNIDAKSAEWSIMHFHTYYAKNGFGLFRDYCTCLTLDFRYLDTSDISHSVKTELRVCYMLKDLTVLIDHYAFSAIQGKYPFEVAFEDTELQDLARRMGFGSLQGLRNLKLEARERQYAKTEAKRKVFADNLRRLEHLAWDRRETQPRKSRKNNNALYSNSRVKLCNDISQLPTSKAKRPSILPLIGETYGLATALSDPGSDGWVSCSDEDSNTSCSAGSMVYGSNSESGGYESSSDDEPDTSCSAGPTVSGTRNITEDNESDTSCSSRPTAYGTRKTTGNNKEAERDPCAEALDRVVTESDNKQARNKLLRSRAEPRLATQGVVHDRNTPSISFFDALLEGGMIYALGVVLALVCMAVALGMGR